MKRKSFAVTLAAAVLTIASTTAFADPGDRGRGNDHRAAAPHAQRDFHDSRRGPDWQSRKDHRPAARHAPSRNHHRVYSRGAGPRHNIHAGSRVPVYYRGNRHVVRDWRGHRLSAPPRGHYWVKTGTDFLLVAAATGIITHLVLSN